MTHSDQSSSNRLLEIDFGRGLAVLALAIIHTLWMYADLETQENSMLGHVVHFIGKGTPAFLLCMGISMMFSSKQTFTSIFKRGLFILGLAYLLNFLKFIVPISVFHTMPESFITAYGWTSPLSTSQLSYLLLTGDILQMAGVALLLLAVIRHFIHSKWGYLILAILITAASRETAGLRFGVDNLDYIAKLFFSGGYHVYFPVVPWMSYILYGMFIGAVLQESFLSVNKSSSEQRPNAIAGLKTTQTPSQVFQKLFYVGIAFIFAGGLLCYLDFEYHFGNFFNLGPGGVLYLLGLNLVLLWIIHQIVKRGFDNVLTRSLGWLSKRVTSIYIIQWVIICWGMGIIGFRTLDATETVMMMIVMLFLTFSIQKLIDLTIGYVKQTRSTVWPTTETH